MSSVDTGGYAFPKAAAVAANGQVADCANEGMRLRDWFAGQALAGEMASQSSSTGEWCNSSPDEAIRDRAKLLYRLADAMLAARKEGA